MVWWEENEDAFRSFREELEDFPLLNYDIDGNKTVVVSGDWQVFGKENLITTYNIQIKIPDDFPIGVPSVYEIGGKLEKKPDNHFNDHDNSACLFARPERYEKWPLGSGIRDFLNQPVKEFFFSQAYHERTGKWPFGDWDHYDVGIIQYYLDRLHLKDEEVLADMIDYVFYEKPARQWRCKCGSKKRLKDCHWTYIKKLNDFLPEEEWTILKKLLEERSTLRKKVRSSLRRRPDYLDK